MQAPPLSYLCYDSLLDGHAGNLRLLLLIGGLVLLRTRLERRQFYVVAAQHQQRVLQHRLAARTADAAVHHRTYTEW